MAWVRFLKDYSWKQPGFDIDYKAGMELNVRRACADDAIAAGKAEEVAPPRRSGYERRKEA